MALLGINQQGSTGQDDRHLDSLRDSFFDMCRRLGTSNDCGRSITYNVRPEDGDISIRRSLPERYDSFHVEQMTLLKNAQGSDDISVYGHYQDGPSDRLILGSFVSAYNDMYVSSSDTFRSKVGIGNKDSVSRNYDIRLPLYEAYVQFSLAVNGEDMKIPSEYKQVSPSRCILDEDYKPVTELEKLLEKLNLGYNNSDNVFTIEKDGYQALVFEHAGQYFLSDWFYDMQEKKLEAVTYPALRSLGVEEILSVAIWASTGADGMLSQTETENMAGVMEKVTRMPVDIPEYDELDVRTSVRAIVLDSILDSDILTAVGREILEKKAYDQKAFKLAKQGKTLSVPAMEYFLRNYWNKADMIKEVVEASRKPGYYGPVVWNYGLDFKVDGWDEFKGLRYARFNDDIECHVLKNDGSTVRLSNLASGEVRHIFAAFKIVQFIRKQMSPDFKPFDSFKAEAAKILAPKVDEKSRREVKKNFGIKT